MKPAADLVIFPPETKMPGVSDKRQLNSTGMDDPYYLQRLQIEEGCGTCNGFINIFTALQNLNTAAADRPEMIGPQTVAALARLLEDRGFENQQKAYFYYLRAAEILVQRAVGRPRSRIADAALNTLQTSLYRNHGPALQAVADSLCQLPLNVRGPAVEPLASLQTPRVDCHELAARHTLKICGEPAWFGRSMAYRLSSPHEKYLLVIKLARKNDRIAALRKEARWLMFLQGSMVGRPRGFDIPKLLCVDNNCVFRLKLAGRRAGWLHPQKMAIGFLAPGTYFKYPNNPATTAPEPFNAIMCRNAWLLGWLAAQGIVHTDPIALFHNRVQAHRRDDNGRYQWFRAGRLDRWLASCDYPNLGPSGIRDFEHLIAFNGANRDLYGHMGNHLLGLLLLAGSYFRNRNRSAVGFGANGEPYDVRRLFEPRLFRQIADGILHNYYEGFTGQKLHRRWPFDLERLVQRLIEEMGIDRHMLEVLRVADQREMSEPEFKDYLHRHGMASTNLKPGVRDIEIFSGPHLGAFNRPISVPELIAAVRAVTALCMLGRYHAFSQPVERAGPNRF
jgi:hypothetical protein